ncbi:MAG TPA: hypothetical protein VLZ81_17500 [Blastocatellia bacterium]|nr:hypothetical protein [Blastocatellia bacterium]
MREPLDRNVLLIGRQLAEQLDALELAKIELDRLILDEVNRMPLIGASNSLDCELGKLRELHQVWTLKLELIRRGRG